MIYYIVVVVVVVVVAVGSFNVATLSLARTGAALVALGPLNNLPFDTHAVVRVRAALLFQVAQARMLNKFLIPRCASAARFRRQAACEGCLVVAPRQKAKLAQQRLVVVQQAAYRQGDVVGIVARALCPRRELGAAVAAEFAARMRGQGRGKAALDAQTRLVGALGKRGRCVPGQRHAQENGRGAGREQA